MAPPTNSELNERREKNCIAISHERKYFRVGNTWVKRGLRPHEWQKQNETGIPLPKLLGCFEDDGAAYLVTEYVEGVGMNDLDTERQAVVTKELQCHILTLKRLTSDTWGGPDKMLTYCQVLPPYRIMRKSDGRPWRMRQRKQQDLVFCHNDLSMNNVIVDPITLKIRAIVDWEYVGFYPPKFEYPFYRRLGPSVPLDGEVDDFDLLTGMISEDRE
ncbi:phosphotransferase enzyme family domain-containing protein [Trichoderma breve]|uniref:Phosphotransferase enzyme family domain-containing protein n=1 Tax=Trichoderma breve TaxID=2034170 RepID=A0A9W9EFC0_9HYPO|nr:phosphotransferase enzyme family domain-containing protein [Trichoderma breve]KAJ4865676.1 phosphotransferase enzyme family domain-containing protein [Trichoderma breve]